MNHPSRRRAASRALPPPARPRAFGLKIRCPAFLLVCSCALVAWAQPVQSTIENERFTVNFVSPGGAFSIIAKPLKAPFLQHASFATADGPVRTGNTTDPIFGTGKRLEVTHADGSTLSFSLFPSLPFVLIKTTLTNRTADPALIRNFVLLSGWLNLGVPANRLKTFGTGGLLAPDQNPGSYAWLAVVEPTNRNGAVFGWLTHNRGSGVVFTGTNGDRVLVDARIDYGRLRIPPAQACELETLAVGFFDDARFGLEAWAEAVAKAYQVHLPPQPSGYCTWYSQPHGGAADEQHLAELAAFAATNLAPYGFSVVQIDDHWQAGLSTNGPKRNFNLHNPRGPYPAGMKTTAENIKSLRLTPGLWFMPFAGTYYDPAFTNHTDWFVKHEDGSPYETAWGGTCLDMTHPGARQYLKQLVQRIANDWGFTYFKMDGLWTGTGTRQQYVNSAFKDDRMGDAVFHDPDKPNIEVFRDGLRLVRDAAGPGVFLLGCNGPQNMRSYGGALGLVDAMRIGPDNGTSWKSLLRGPTFGTRHYFLHGRIWYNDPDPVYVRPTLPLNHARLLCSWVTLSGQLNLSSEWLPGLPADRLDLLKRTLPAHTLKPRPADLFDRELPSLWLLTDARKPRRDVIGVFNWSDQEQSFDDSLERLGLSSLEEYDAFDFWNNTMSSPLKERLKIIVPAQSCAVLAVRAHASHPQILSTSRHITQGIIDLMEETWEAGTRTLKGRSKVVGGDPYELRIIAGSRPKGITISPSGPATTATLKSDGALVRATINSAVSAEVSFAVQFE